MKFEIHAQSKVISLQAETQAEQLQMRALEHEMKEKGVMYGTWSDTTGNQGLTVYALSVKEFPGGGRR